MSTLLLECAKNGDLEGIKLLLNKGADPKYKDESGMTAVLIAAKYGHTHIVKYLVENNISQASEKDPANNNLLMIAIQGGHVNLVEYLMLYAEFNLNDKNNAGQHVFYFMDILKLENPQKAQLISNALTAVPQQRYLGDDLCRSIEQVPQYRKVIIRDCKNTNSSDLLKLADALRKSNVEILIIENSPYIFFNHQSSNNHTTSSEVVEIFSEFIDRLKHTAVHTLSLRGNKLGSRLYKNPGLAFKHLKNTRIKTLDLSDNDFNGFIPSYIGRSDGCKMVGNDFWNTGITYIDYQGERRMKELGQSLRCVETLNLSDQSLQFSFQNHDDNPAFKALVHFACGLEGGRLRTLIMNNGCFTVSTSIPTLSPDKQRLILIEFMKALGKVQSLSSVKLVNNWWFRYNEYEFVDIEGTGDRISILKDTVIQDLKKLSEVLCNASIRDLEFDFGDLANEALFKIFKDTYQYYNLKLASQTWNNTDVKVIQECNSLGARNRAALLVSEFAECTPLMRNVINLILEYYGDAEVSCLYNDKNFFTQYSSYLTWKANRPAPVPVALPMPNAESTDEGSNELTNEISLPAGAAAGSTQSNNSTRYRSGYIRRKIRKDG